MELIFFNAGFLCSILFSLAFPNLIFKEGINLYGVETYLSFLGLILGSSLFFLPEEKIGKKCGVLGIASGFYVLIFYWVYIPMEAFKGISQFNSHLLGLVFFIIHIVPYIINIFLYKKLAPYFSLPILNILCALLFSIGEFVFPQIVPLNPAHCLLRVGATQIWASWGGVPLISFLLYWFLFSLSTESQLRKKMLILVLGIVIYHLPGPFSKMDLENNSKPLRINLVQPNTPNTTKLDVEKGGIRAFANHLQNDLIKTSGSEYADLIIWPETAIPFNLLIRDIGLGVNQLPVLKQGMLNSPALLTGVYIATSPEEVTATNSAVLLVKGELKGRYDKGYLKPFSETFPIPWLEPWVSSFLSSPYTVIQGKDFHLFDYMGFNFITTICYEALKSNYWRTYLNSLNSHPQFMVNIANDKWFKDSSQPFLHYYMNQWRSLEFDLPIIRSANAGVSGVIFPENLNFFKTNVHVKSSHILDLKISQRKPTFYQIYGIVPTLLMGLFCLCLIHFLRKIKVLRPKQTA